LALATVLRGLLRGGEVMSDAGALAPARASAVRLAWALAVGAVALGPVTAPAVAAAPGDPPVAYTNAAAFRASLGPPTSVVDFEEFNPGGASSCGIGTASIPNPVELGALSISHPACVVLAHEHGSIQVSPTERVEFDYVGLFPLWPHLSQFATTTLTLSATCGIGFYPRFMGNSASSRLEAMATTTDGASTGAFSNAAGIGSHYFLGFSSSDGLADVVFDFDDDFAAGNPVIDYIELIACPGAPDSDGDGVPDGMDVEVAVPGSVGLSDAVAPDVPAIGIGTSAVITPNGLNLAVEDLDPAVASSAVRIAATGAGGPMAVAPCGLPITLTLSAGDTITIDCGSVAIDVEQGDGIAVTSGFAWIAIPSGASATLDVTGGATVVQSVSGGTIEVTVDGVSVPIAPGSAPAAFLAGHDFIGFGPPVDPDPIVNVAKSGSAIPLTWRVLDMNGTPVTRLLQANVGTKLSGACAGGADGDDIEQYVASNQTSLQNRGNGYYQLNWKTNKAWAGTCRELVLSLDGARVLDANAVFRFK
jgi:hypothetical protein